MSKRSLRTVRGDARKVGRTTGFQRSVKGAKFSKPMSYAEEPAPYSGRFAGPSGELKFHDVDLNSGLLGILSPMTIQHLTIIPIGNGESQRIGRKISIRSIRVQGTLELRAHTLIGLTTGQVVVRLVQDTQTNGTQFSATDLLDTDQFQSFRKLSETSRFKILYEKTFNLSAGGATEVAGALETTKYSRPVNVAVKVKIPMEYSSLVDTGEVGSVRSNNVYWTTQASHASCTITARARLRYSDN